LGVKADTIKDQGWIIETFPPKPGYLEILYALVEEGY
jgi:hypothetical protein